MTPALCGSGEVSHCVSLGQSLFQCTSPSYSLHLPPQQSDYPHLQQKVSELGKQLQASERQLAGVRAEHRKQSTEQLRLQRRLAQPSAEHLALQAGVEMCMLSQYSGAPLLWTP